MRKIFLLLATLAVFCDASVFSSAILQTSAANPLKSDAARLVSTNSLSLNLTSKPKFDFGSSVGAAEILSETEACLVISNDALSKGDKVSAILADEPKSQSVINAVVEKKVDSCGNKIYDNSGKTFYYSLKITGRKPKSKSANQDTNTVAIAFVGDSQTVSITKGVASADLNGDGKRERFRTCTSSEGLHLTVWSGLPLKSKRQWHNYVGLGFDTVPSCTKKDY